MNKYVFTPEEFSLIVAIIKRIDPNLYNEDDVKALIYKIRSIRVGDHVTVLGDE